MSVSSWLLAGDACRLTKHAPTGIVNIFTGMYILGRELRLIPFNTWARHSHSNHAAACPGATCDARHCAAAQATWSATSLGCLWLLGAAVQKTVDQRERGRAASAVERQPTPTLLAKRHAETVAQAAEREA